MSSEHKDKEIHFTYTHTKFSCKVKKKKKETVNMYFSQGGNEI